MDLGSASSAISTIPIDWLIIGAFFIIVSADALRAGSVRACALAISFPLSYFLVQMVPQSPLLGPAVAQFSSPFTQAILFLIIELLLFVCLHHMLASYDRYTSLLSSVVAGACATVVVLVIWVQLPALQSLWHFSIQVQNIFGGQYQFFWLIGAYLALAFVGS